MSKPRFMMSLFYSETFLLLSFFKQMTEKIIRVGNEELWDSVFNQGLPTDT